LSNNVRYSSCFWTGLAKVFAPRWKNFNTRKKEHINYIKHFLPDKRALAKHAVELERRISWPQTQIAAFEQDLEKDDLLNRFSLILHPTP